MRDGNGNEFVASGPLKDANGNPIVHSSVPALSPVADGTAETLRLLKIEYGALVTKFAKLAGDYDVLKAEHDETLLDVGEISDAHQAIQAEHADLKEVHALAIEKITNLEAKPAEAPVDPPKVEVPAVETVSNVAIEPFPLDQAS